MLKHTSNRLANDSTELNCQIERSNVAVKLDRVTELQFLCGVSYAVASALAADEKAEAVKIDAHGVVTISLLRKAKVPNERPK